MPEIPGRLATALADRYRLERELGQGGMATVYLAADLKHERQVALKVMKPDLAAAMGAERFLREIKIAAQLHHSHVLPLYDSGEADGFLYYVMPYEEGQSLRAKLAREGELPISDAIRILRDVVDALDHAHKRGVVHRDIKPDNVMITERHALVTDFGVAKAVSEATGRQAITTAGIALGTPSYMAPEQAAADPNVDHRADIYAVGALAYELLTGHPPFTGSTAQAILSAHVTQVPDPVTKHRDTVPPALEALVMRCLAKKPADRWQSAADLLPQLDALATPSAGVTPTDTKPIEAVRFGRKTVAPLAASIVLVGAGLAFWLTRGGTPSGLDPDRLAVAPFDVLGSSVDSSWGDGLALLLRNALDGAGGISTAEANQAIRRWHALATPTPGGLGQTLGTGLVLTGTVVAAGSDSVRISATLHDVETDRAVGPAIELRLASDRIDNAADSVAVQVLGRLSGTRPEVGGFRLASIGSDNPTAIRAFLSGERFYRAGTMDSALASYERAVEADSTFALAYSRVSLVNAWGSGSREVAHRSRLLAGRLNHGLAPRESLLVLADSLWATLGGSGGQVTDLAASRQPAVVERLGRVLREATRRYPTDPQVWYQLAEYRFHLAWATTTEDELREAFTRATAVDSQFSIPYVHLLGLVGTRDEKLEWMRGFLRGDFAGTLAGVGTGVGPALEVLSSERPDTLDWEAIGSRLTDRERGGLARMLGATIDAGDLAVQAARVSPSPFMKGLILVSRGHAQEALAAFPDNVPSSWRSLLAIELGLLGALDPDTVDALSRGHRGIGFSLSPSIAAFPWWSARGDTLALAAGLLDLADRFDSVMAVGRTLERLQTLARAWAVIPADSQLTSADSVQGMQLYREKWIEPSLQYGRGHMALARGDTAEALRLFREIPSNGFEGCGGAAICRYNRLHIVELLIARGDDREAAQLLAAPLQPYDDLHWPMSVVWVLERGRVNERLGNREVAVAAYSHVIDMWATADSALQERHVQPAREGLARLTGER